MTRKMKRLVTTAAALVALTAPVIPVLAQNVYAVFECYNICDSDYWAKKLVKRVWRLAVRRAVAKQGCCHRVARKGF
jgi:hypothetical protein